LEPIKPSSRQEREKSIEPTDNVSFEFVSCFENNFNLSCLIGFSLEIFIQLQAVIQALLN